MKYKNVAGNYVLTACWVTDLNNLCSFRAVLVEFVEEQKHHSIDAQADDSPRQLHDS